MNKAVGWAEYLESHAQRIYGSVLHPASPAHALAVRILKGEVGDGFTICKVQRRSWSGLSSRDDVVNAVELLEDLHWLCRWKVMTGGAPQTRYYLNPKIQQTPSRPTAKTDVSASDTPSVSNDSDSVEGSRDISRDEGEVGVMEGVILLKEAADHGLTVNREDDRLIVRGPKRAASVALRLLEHKVDVLAALQPTTLHSDFPTNTTLRDCWLPDDELSTSDRCRTCGKVIIWGTVDPDLGSSRRGARWIPLDPDWPFPHRCRDENKKTR